MSEARIFYFGPFLLVPERQLLTRGDARVQIGGRALDLLTALVERPGELLSKKDLMVRVWPTTTVDESNLKVNIAALRRALGDDVGAVKYIATMPGRGYRFIAPVETRAAFGQPREAPAGEGSLQPPERESVGWTEHDGDLCVPTDASMLDVSDQWTGMRVVNVPSIQQPRAGLSPLHDLFERAGYGIVIDGEMTLWFDETVVLLKPGSVVTRRGSNHPIETLSAGPCRMLCVLVPRDRDVSIVSELCSDI